MAFTLNRRLSTLVDSSGQLKTGKIPNDYIGSDHIADNIITTAMLHSGFTLPTSSLSSIDTDNVSEGSSNLYFTNARVDSRLSGGTGVTYSSGAISIGQAVATTDNVTFADLTVTGDLTITGDINSYNVTDLDVADKTITVGAGQTESNSGGSGLIVDGASASILWDETNDQFDFNKGINVDSNTLVVDGTNNRVGILNASPDVTLDLGSATDGIHMPVGTTGQRPSSPAAGYFRYNSTDGQFEGYTTEWGAIAGSGGASAMETNNFTGDGSTTAFTLSSTVASEDNLIVFIEGIYQNKGDYVASGTTITFTTAPVNGRRIVVQHILSSVSGNSTLYTSLTGDGITTAFTLSGAPGHENNTQVFMDGVYQQKDSYIVNGTTLTFDAAPANSAEIEVMSFTQTTVNTPGAGTITPAMIASGDFTFDTNTLAIDATNNRVGIGTTSPASPLHVNITGAGDAVKIQGNSITDFDFVGNPPEFNLEDTSSSTNTKRARLTVDDNKISIQGVVDDDTTVNHTFFSGDLSNGNVTLSNYVQLGAIGGSTPSATPVEINMGDTYSNTAGSAAKAKLKIYEDTSSNIYGFGVSSGTLEYHNSYSSGKHDWYIGTDRKMRLTHDGNIDLATNNTGSLRIPNGTTAQQPTPATGMMRYNTTNTKMEAYIGSAWENVNTTPQSLTGISGLDVWADVTGGISSTTIADLSGNNRTGTLSNTGHSGTLNGNTYMLFNAANRYLSYGDKPSGLGNYAGDVTFFFVLTNTNGFSTYRTLLGDSSGSAGYQIIRTNGSTDDWNFYNQNVSNSVATSSNTALTSNASINSTQIIIFSFGSQSSGDVTVYKREGGSEGSDGFSSQLPTNSNWAFSSNTSSTFYIGNSSWANEYYNGGIFAWGIIDHEITSSERSIIYDYYATKNIGN